jgi:hypothetical protein
VLELVEIQLVRRQGRVGLGVLAEIDELDLDALFGCRLDVVSQYGSPAPTTPMRTTSSALSVASAEPASALLPAQPASTRARGRASAAAATNFFDMIAAPVDRGP